jgi:hypothetical protein
LDAYLGDFVAQWERVTQMRKPVIAAVAGFALGGGSELAMMCDFILAADNAKFGQPEIKLGVLPGAGGTQRLTHLVGKSKAMEMCLTGRMMDAQEAERAGLVSRIVPVADLIPEAIKVAQSIAAMSLPAVMMAKECINRAYETTLSEGIKHRLYFLSSQSSWDWAEYLPRVLPSAKGILAKVAQYPVTNPDLPVILKVISQLRMDGSAPFPELTDFKVKCFAALPVSHVQRMTLSEILQAYVAIYQAPPIWKDVFRSVVGVLSVSLIRACETFVRANPFNAEAFIQLLVKSGA